MSLLNESELFEWQNKTHKEGLLLSIWDHETNKEIPCFVIKDCNKTINPFGRKSKIRKITIMSKYGTYEVSKYEIFPSGEARPSIPF